MVATLERIPLRDAWREFKRAVETSHEPRKLLIQFRPQVDRTQRLVGQIFKERAWKARKERREFLEAKQQLPLVSQAEAAQFASFFAPPQTDYVYKPRTRAQLEADFRKRVRGWQDGSKVATIARKIVERRPTSQTIAQVKEEVTQEERQREPKVIRVEHIRPISKQNKLAQISAIASFVVVSALGITESTRITNIFPDFLKPRQRNPIAAADNREASPLTTPESTLPQSTLPESEKIVDPPQVTSSISAEPEQKPENPVATVPNIGPVEKPSETNPYANDLSRLPSGTIYQTEEQPPQSIKASEIDTIREQFLSERQVKPGDTLWGLYQELPSNIRAGMIIAVRARGYNPDIIRPGTTISMTSLDETQQNLLVEALKAENNSPQQLALLRELAKYQPERVSAARR